MVLGGNLLGKHRPDTAAGTCEDNGFASQVKMFDALIQAGRQGKDGGAHVAARTNHQTHVAVEYFVHGLLGHFVRRGSGFKVHQFADSARAFVHVFAVAGGAARERADDRVELVLGRVTEGAVNLGVDRKERIGVLAVC